MAQANFAYSLPASDPAGVPLALSIFADRADVRLEMRGDAEMAGFRLAQVGGLDLLLDGEASGLGGVVMVDCLRNVQGLKSELAVRIIGSDR